MSGEGASGRHRRARREGPSASAAHHRRHAPRRIPSAVLTVSDTRSEQTDSGGALLVELLEGAGHPVAWRRIVRDDVDSIRAAVGEALAREEVRAVILTGGTGMAPRDVTPEALEPLFERPIPGFGELFRRISYDEIGPAALLSRACAGLAGGRAIFALPGSRGAIRTAMEQLILPELGHLVGEGVKEP